MTDSLRATLILHCTCTHPPHYHHHHQHLVKGIQSLKAFFYPVYKFLVRRIIFLAVCRLERKGVPLSGKATEGSSSESPPQSSSSPPPGPPPPPSCHHQRQHKGLCMLIRHGFASALHHASRHVGAQGKLRPDIHQHNTDPRPHGKCRHLLCALMECVTTENLKVMKAAEKGEGVTCCSAAAQSAA